MIKRNDMKKFSVLLVLAVIMAGACNKSKAPTKTSIAQLEDDYYTVTSQYADAEGHLVEARYTLNYMVSEQDAGKLWPTDALYLFNLGWDEETETCTLVIFERSLEDEVNHFLSKQSYNTPWTPEKDITDFGRLITLARAIEIVKGADIPDPETRYVTLCHPEISAELPNPVYLFQPSSADDPFTVVDAVTGEVSRMPIDAFTVS